MDIKKLAADARAEALRHPALPMSEIMTRFVAARTIEECIREIDALHILSITDPDIVKARIKARLLQIGSAVRLP
jgi:hypothetical protein